MASMEEPKKPQTAYFLFLNENRAAISKELAGAGGFGAVAKRGAEKWKTLPQSQKAAYEKRAQIAKAEYEKELAAFKAAGGEVGKRRAEKKEKKAEKSAKRARRDSGMPKRPAGGGYGCFLSEKRDEILASLPKGSNVAAVGKAAGERWKALSEKAKEPYVKAYEVKKAAYEQELKAWKEKQGEAAAGEEEEEEEGEEEEDVGEEDV